jgi:HD-like signal output (HDOD) protein
MNGALPTEPTTDARTPVRENPAPQAATDEIVGAEIDRCTAYLPPIPAILHKLEAEMSSEWANVSRMANLVRTDPSLAGSVLKVANSPLWRGVTQVTEVEDAIQRLGKNNLKSIATVMALKQGGFPEVGLLGSTMHEFWRHSLLVAAGSVQIVRAESTDHSLLDQVWFAGLLHDLGALVAPLLYPIEWERMSDHILTRTPESDPTTLNDLSKEYLGIDYARIGGAFASRAWKIPQTVSVLASLWPIPDSVEPPYVAWAIHRADLAAQTLGVCWQPESLRARTFENLPPDTSAGAAVDADFCRMCLEKHRPLVDALLAP